MSVSNKEISSCSGIVDRDDDDDEDEDECGTRKKKQTAAGGRYGSCGGGFWFSRGFGKKAKSFVLSPLKRKQIRGKAKAEAKVSSSGNDSESVNRKGCCFCLGRPSSTAEMSSESPRVSHCSDPNEPNFTYDMLRVLIERNDFCCEQCNTHLGYEDDSS